MFTIIIDNSREMHQLIASFMIVIYNHHIFIVQATGPEGYLESNPWSPDQNSYVLQCANAVQLFIDKILLKPKLVFPYIFQLEICTAKFH